MSRHCGTGAALIFTAFVLAGCSLVESVLVVEPVKEKKLAAAEKFAKAAASAPGAGKCGQIRSGAARCAEEMTKAYSARYDSGPVLKPIKKSPEPKLAEPDSLLVKTVKNFFRTGMQLHNWIANE